MELPAGDPSGSIGDATLVVVDPVAGRVPHRRNLHGTTATAVGLGDRVVLLTTPAGRIGPAGLAAAHGRGGLRSAPWLVPPAEAKLVSGPIRSACWLGDGLLAVWGSEARVAADPAGSQR